jgi:prepilin signal peptidase PulO-like enzyme (type II secretory pathway)
MPINVLYPISELFLGVIFFIFFFLNAPIVDYLFLLILFFWGMYDISYQYIPKRLTDLVLFSSILIWFISVLQNFSTERLIPVAVVGVLGAILIIASQVKKAFGLGDIIVLVILGFWLNIQMLAYTLFFAIALGGLVSVILVIYDRSYLKKYIPFLPFFFLGFVFAFVLFDYLRPLFDSITLLW